MHFQYGNFNLTIDKISEAVTSADLKILSPDSCIFNAEGLEGFYIRGKLDGDRFRLPGSGTKKIKDFYIDEKISLERREETFILEDKEGHIIAFYVPGFGFRVSEDFYVKTGRSEAVKVNVERTERES